MISSSNPVVAISREGKFYCLPCMANMQVESGDEQLSQADVDVWKLHPGWQVLCSGCDKVLSSPDEQEVKEASMQIKVQTKHPNRFIREVGKTLRSKGHSKAEADELLNGQFDGERVSWDGLSTAQFYALEDTAVRMGLEYDGRQA